MDEEERQVFNTVHEEALDARPSVPVEFTEICGG